MFLANEMIQLGLKPDRITYDRLILVCVRSGELEDALLYYEEMSSGDDNRAMKPRRGTFETLIQECVKRGDDRAVALLKDYKESVEDPRVGVEKAVVDRFEYGIERAPRGVGSKHSQNARSDSLGDQHVKPTTGTRQTPDVGADTERSEARTGFFSPVTKHNTNVGTEMEASADLRHGQS